MFSFQPQRRPNHTFKRKSTRSGAFERWQPDMYSSPTLLIADCRRTILSVLTRRLEDTTRDGNSDNHAHEVQSGRRSTRVEDKEWPQRVKRKRLAEMLGGVSQLLPPPPPPPLSKGGTASPAGASQAFCAHALRRRRRSYSTVCSCAALAAYMMKLPVAMQRNEATKSSAKPAVTVKLAPKQPSSACGTTSA